MSAALKILHPDLPRIETGVAMPPSLRARRYPFWDMTRGDSFFIACEPDGRRRLQKIIATAAARFAQNNGDYRFAARQVEGGVRCWRVK